MPQRKMTTLQGHKNADDSEPGGYNKVFTDLPQALNCEVCRMTKTTLARNKNRLLIRANGIAPPTSFGDLITADHKNLELRRRVKS